MNAHKGLTLARLEALALVDAPAALVLSSAGALNVLRSRRWDARHHGGHEAIRAKAATGDWLAQQQVRALDELLAQALERLAVRARLMAAGVRGGEHGTRVEHWWAREVPNPHWPALRSHGVWAMVSGDRGTKRMSFFAEVQILLPDLDRTQFCPTRSFRSDSAARRWAVRVARAGDALVRLVEAENAATGLVAPERRFRANAAEQLRRCA